MTYFLGHFDFGPYVKSDVINGCSLLKKLTLTWQICHINIRHLIDFAAELTCSLIFCLHSVWKLPNLSHTNQDPTCMEHTVNPWKMSGTTIEYQLLKYQGAYKRTLLMIFVHSNPNSKMKNTLFLVVLFALAQHIYSQQCQAGNLLINLLKYLW